MAQYNPHEIIVGRTFYTYDEELYAPSFPKEWAKNHLPKTGPKECKTCVNYGSWNGAFLGYCIHCAKKYCYDRGHGFNYPGEEQNLNIQKLRAFETYLHEIDLNNVGDKDICDTDALYGSTTIYSADDEMDDTFDELNQAMIMDESTRIALVTDIYNSDYDCINLGQKYYYA